jgi:lipopolysaccharide/colanic/teichoic acid biosynthesis glycosyltransferase
MKRALDLVGSAVGIAFLLPLFAAVGAAVKLSSPGPVLYRAERVGRFGKPFHLLKFRTMRVEPGPRITRHGDPRVTRVGRFLRRTKLDELPQLFNVLRGEMSLVGPRPEDPRYVALYSAEQRAVLEVPPGITSPASVQYRNEESLLAGEEWEEHYRTRIMPEKLRIELDYLRRRTMVSDLQLIVRTIISVAR